MDYQYNLSFAQDLDKNDPLAKYREAFHFPQHEGKDVLYFTGNSLGLQPKSTRAYINEVLADWASFGVEGHFDAQKPWFDYHKQLTPAAAKIVGAQENEVVCMGGLTGNLHFLLVSFYRPNAQRFKIICEAKAFPSDQYVLETQIKHHGLDPKDVLVEIAPRAGEHLIREEDILKAINDHGNALALVFIGGVNYYTGQLFDMKTISQAAHKVGAYAGFDLAHAAGNVPLALHEWGVDFAAWCTYKYLNSSPGGLSGIYIHEKHVKDTSLPRFGGWWGHNEERRFLMEPGFDPSPTAEGWQLSNAPILLMAAHKASLDMFEEVGMEALRKKSLLLTGYLEFLMHELGKKYPQAAFEIISPSESSQRGCQLSMLTKNNGKALFDYLSARGVVADWREPNVIRLAPVPLYNSFEDMYQFAQLLEQAIQTLN